MLARRLKELRFQNDLTQTQFAQALGVAQQTVGGWEKNNSSPNYDLLNKIADYFNVTTDYLLGRDMQAPAPLSLQQTALIRGFDGLNEDGQATLLNVLAGLREVFPVTRRVTKSKSHVSAKVINGNLHNSGGNFNSPVSSQ